MNKYYNKGKNNNNYKTGKYCIPHFCECGKEIDKLGRSKKCIQCFNKTNDSVNNGNYKKGLYSNNKPKCINCEKEINIETYLSGTKRCKKCSYIYRAKIHKQKTIKHYCIDCKKEIYKKSVRCHSCNMSNMLKDKKFVIKLIKNSLKNQSRKQSNPERLLSYLLPDNFSYTGKSEFMIGRYNPDFIDIKNKKIIELFGDYWHNLPNYKKRDAIKLKLYKKLGYKTLIIWARELKNINKLQLKLIKFL